MKTSIKKSFEVPQSVEVVWEHLIDPEKIVSCVPGVSVSEKIDDRHYKGKVGMKFGPLGVQYDADICYDEVHVEDRKIVITGNGVDSGGKGNATMKMILNLVEKDGGGTTINTIMEITIIGKIAQFGSRLIETVSNQLFKQFVANFSKKLAEEAKKG